MIQGKGLHRSEAGETGRRWKPQNQKEPSAAERGSGGEDYGRPGVLKALPTPVSWVSSLIRQGPHECSLGVDRSCTAVGSKEPLREIVNTPRSSWIVGKAR